MVIARRYSNLDGTFALEVDELDGLAAHNGGSLCEAGGRALEADEVAREAEVDGVLRSFVSRPEEEKDDEQEEENGHHPYP